MTTKAMYVVTVLVFAIAIALPCMAQEPAGNAVDPSIEALRADARADKVAIVTEAMQLSAKESEAFWPVYRKYDQEMIALNDELIKIVKSYADKFGTISDADAATLTAKTLDLQERRIAIKKKYVPMFAKATSALTAAKFFQLDYRLELLVNLKLASELPALLVQVPDVSAPAKQK